MHDLEQNGYRPGANTSQVAYSGRNVTVQTSTGLDLSEHLLDQGELTS